MKRYPIIKSGDLEDLGSVVKQICTFRNTEDINDWNNLNKTMVLGRLTYRVPSSTSDVATGDIVGDFVPTPTYLYILVANSGSPIWIRLASSWAAPTVAAAYSSPGFVTNRYYMGFLARDEGVTAALTANRLYLEPLMLGAAATFTRIGIRVSAFAAGAARLGIYNMVDGLPTTLVLDAGTVNTGTNGIKEITISQALTAGCYALALVANNTSSINMSTHDTPPADFFGMDDSGQLIGYYGAYTAFSYAALPSPWSGALTYQNTDSLTPGIWLRVV